MSQPALPARLSGSSGQNDSDGPLTPADLEACAQGLEASAAALRASADRWRASADPTSASTRMRMALAIAADVWDAAEALSSITDKAKKGKKG